MIPIDLLSGGNSAAGPIRSPISFDPHAAQLHAGFLLIVSQHPVSRRCAISIQIAESFRIIRKIATDSHDTKVTQSHRMRCETNTL